MQIRRLIVLVAIACAPLDTSSGQSCTPESVALGADTLISRFEGMADGLEVYGLARTRTGFEFRSVMDFPKLLRRTTIVELDPSFKVLRVRSEGAVGAVPIASDVRYDGRRASGYATPIQTANPTRQRIDTVLPPEAFDGKALFPLLLCRAGGVGSKTTLTLYDTDELNISRQSLRVVARETLTLPSGREAALRAELSTTQLPVTIWFTESRPRRLLKIASANGASTRNR